MKIKITYTEKDTALFERIRAELLQTIPGGRQHSSTAPGGFKVWYLVVAFSKQKQ